MEVLCEPQSGIQMKGVIAVASALAESSCSGLFSDRSQCHSSLLVLLLSLFASDSRESVHS